MKSHVSMEKKCCVACTKVFDTGSLLLKKDLRPTLERNTTTGWGLCPDCKQKVDEGFVILVGADPKKSQINHTENGDRAQPEDAYRTGEIIYVKREVARQMFNTDIKDVAFVEPEVVEWLKKKESENR